MQFSTVSCGLAMRTFSINDAQNPNEYEEDAMGENVRIGNAEIESNGRRLQETSPYFCSHHEKPIGKDVELQGR